MKFLVYSENSSLAAQLVAAAKAADEAAEVYTVATAANAANLTECGADAVYAVEAPADISADDMAPSVAALADAADAACVLVGATRLGRAAAARIACGLGTAAITDAVELAVADGQVQVARLTLGGKLRSTYEAYGNRTVVLAGGGLAEAQQAPACPIEQAAYVAPATPLEVLGLTTKQKSTTNLADSEIVVCAGRGAASEEQLDLCRSLADALGGDLGCSRPVTEGTQPLMPTELYIGASGVTVKPKLYVGVGVSGQTQHTIGMNGSDVVVAIDKNKDCLMFRQADYCLNGDLNAIVPALTSALGGGQA